MKSSSNKDTEHDVKLEHRHEWSSRDHSGKKKEQYSETDYAYNGRESNHASYNNYHSSRGRPKFHPTQGWKKKQNFKAIEIKPFRSGRRPLGTGRATGKYYQEEQSSQNWATTESGWREPLHSKEEKKTKHHTHQHQSKYEQLEVEEFSSHSREPEQSAGLSTPEEDNTLVNEKLDLMIEKFKAQLERMTDTLKENEAATN